QRVHFRSDLLAGFRPHHARECHNRIPAARAPIRRPAPGRDAVTDLAPSESTGDLGKRAASGIVMASLAVGAVVLGGWPFTLFWAAAAVGVFWEWSAMAVGGAVAARMVGIAALIAGAAAAGAGQIDAASMVLAGGVAAVAAACAPGRRGWGAA